MISVTKPPMEAATMPMPTRKIRSRMRPRRQMPPADENGGGIKIGDRGAAFEIHAEEKAGGVNDEREDQQFESGAPDGFG